ncbi:DNA topoisomerase I [Candidatus Omnitrophus magneticus]|uniref:DNA topoisomerase 1 n=1 Tax=Candidatus Omnitrophus magneticus TaxID=1609969 RepID=A0A0F0CL87_9BACT|nr:DNA topoisomerase I [Candidatus Omnitrophus magneticus]
MCFSARFIGKDMNEEKSIKKIKATEETETSGKFLVIVESPAKSKTINKILGNNYKVIASMGHIKDLPGGRMGIDFNNNFNPEYCVIKGRNKQVEIIKSEAKKSKAVYLAADPDREGEAICWHIKNEITKSVKKIYRVRFEEITDKAIKEAFNKITDLDMNKINAQQARRVLDRIVGYSLSPVLWGKISKGLSAGRVQSVALRLIVEREEEIRKFKPEEYWSIDALLSKNKDASSKSVESLKFKAKLMKFKDEKILVTNQAESDKIINDLKNAVYKVNDVSRKDKKSSPRSPYTTSMLQQDAFNKLNFSASKTMRVAQKLYEGVELGEEGSAGLITYMRTDSVRISSDAAIEAKKYILDEYGDKYYPEKANFYKSKKGAQEAHEAIRPTLPLRKPEEVAKYLEIDELKLYRLIWKRFIASQMSSALYSVLTVKIDAGDYEFRAGGADLIFDGFLAVYKGEKYSEETIEGESEIPSLEKGEITKLVELLPEQHFTKAPPRYSDASLVKVLEEKGIGRPSTYAPIIKTLIARDYIKRVVKYFGPTDLGELVNKLLVENFPDIIDYDFTAKMEGELDEIEEGKTEWINSIKAFYDPFIKNLALVKDKMKHVNKEVIDTGQKCEKCGRAMVIKWGRRGKFLSCAGFPECKNAKSITTGVKCPSPDCGGELIERKSKRGPFYGCSKYPKCTFTVKTLKALVPEQKNNAEGAVEDSDDNSNVDLIYP